MGIRSIAHPVLNALTIALLALVAGTVKADAESDYDRLKDECFKQQNAGNYAEALKMAAELRRLAEGPLRHDRDKLLWAVNRQASVLEDLREFAEAERLYLWALDEAKRLDGGQSDSAGIVMNNLGLLYSHQDRYAEAKSLFDQSLEIHRKTRSRLLAATTLSNLGSLYKELARYEDAQRSYQEALSIREKKFGRKHADVTLTLNNLAILFTDWGYLKDALALNREVLDTNRELFPGDHPRVATSLHNLGHTYQAMADYAKAEENYLQALAMRQRLFGENDIEIAGVLNNLAVLYDQMGRYAEAERTYQRSLEIREKQLGREHCDIAQALHNMAWNKRKLGRHEEAESLCRRALAIYRKSLGDRHPDVARVLISLGDLCASMARYDEAEAMLKEALDISQKGLPRDHPALGRALNDMAVFYSQRGRYAEAEPLFAAALSNFRANYGEDHPEVANALNNLAVLYAAESRLVAAISTQKQAVDISRKVLGQEHPDTAMRLGTLGKFYIRQGDYDEAEPLCVQALQTIQKRFGPTHLDTAAALANLAELYAMQQRYDKAESLALTAMAAGRLLLGDDHPLLAQGRCAFAGLYRLQKRYEEAEVLLNQAIPVLEKHAETPASRVGAYGTRAEVRWDSGRREAAVEDLRRAMVLAEQVRAQASGGEQRRSWSFARFVGAFEKMVAWQTELGDANAALNAMERGRARALLDQMETRAMDLLAGVSTERATALLKREWKAAEEVAKCERQLQIIQQRRDLSAAEREKQQKELQEKLSNARWDNFDAYEDIRNASPAYRMAVGRDLKPIDLSSLREFVVQRDAILLEYLVGIAGGYVLVVPKQGPARLETLTVDEKQAATLRIPPGPLTAERLQTVLSGGEHEGLMQLLKQSRQSDKLAAAQPRLMALWELLVPGPERKAILAGEAKRLIVIPDGILARLPFETLVTASSAEPAWLLAKGPPVQYAPSATILVNLATHPRPDRKMLPESVLTVGNPVYGVPEPPEAAGMVAQLESHSRFHRAGGRLSSLPYTDWETTWIAEVFGAQKIEVSRLQREFATEAAVRQKAPGRRILHLACHGLVDEAYGNFFGALALTPGAVGDPADDGFLTLPEICRLDLAGCELAILSACDTNYGPEQHGEGVCALSRGFLVAGARRIVASNWLVDDEAAASLVSYFASIIAKAESEGCPPDYAEALWKAKCWARTHEKWKSPYYWAPFVLVGPN